MIDRIGHISSIITLVSFMLYLVGRAIRIRLAKEFRTVNIEVIYNQESHSKSSYKIVGEYYIGDDYSEKVIIFPDEHLRWVKIYACESGAKRGKLVAQHGLLKKGHAICIYTYLPCGIPSFLVEFQRHDYIKGKFYIAANNKNGILETQVELFYNLASYLYYLVD